MAAFVKRSSVSSVRKCGAEDEAHEQIRLVSTPDPDQEPELCLCAGDKMTNLSSQRRRSVDRRNSDTPYKRHKDGDADSSGGGSNDADSQRHVDEDPQSLSPYAKNILAAKAIKQSQRRSALQKLRQQCKCAPVDFLLSLFPILSWLPKYNWRQDLTYDLIAGMTVCVMHIPQGMGYALLAELKPVVGIYMALFPIVIYSVMGTSRHISMGTFAVVCLMTGKVVTQTVDAYMEDGGSVKNDSMLLGANSNEQSKYTNEEVATIVSLAVGLWQLLFGVFQMGSLCVLLSPDLISGFTTGASIHVFTSQVKNLLGLSIQRRNGILKIPLTYSDVFSNIGESNVTAIIISAITITALFSYNEFLKPLVAKKIPFPLPVELLTIIIGTLVSKYWITTEKYSIPIVSDIPTGLPAPAVPPLEVFPDVLLDSLIIAIVAYSISVSMAKIFGAKHDYPVAPNQELLANGSSNIVGSFFNCGPIAASLSRSVIQEQVGGRTQLTGLVSCGILVVVLLWIAPFFETLPHCVLSSMIVVALKGMLMQVTELPKAYKESPLSALVWLSSFLATVFLDIEYGLGVGLLFSIFSLIWRSNKPHFQILGVQKLNDNALFYADIKLPDTKELPGVKIVKYTGSINFATVENFTENLNEIVPIKRPKKKKNTSNLNGVIVSTISKEKIHDNISVDDNFSEFHPETDSDKYYPDMVNWLILDLSSVSSVDPTGVKAMTTMVKQYRERAVSVLFAGCAFSVVDTMDKVGLVKVTGMRIFYPSVYEAVTANCTTVQLEQVTVETQH